MKLSITVEADSVNVLALNMGRIVVDRCRSLINAAVSLVANKKGINDGK